MSSVVFSISVLANSKTNPPKQDNKHRPGQKKKTRVHWTSERGEKRSVTGTLNVHPCAPWLESTSLGDPHVPFGYNISISSNKMHINPYP